MSNIVVHRTGLAGFITLDRPEALNSLTHEMISDIHLAIRQHEADDEVDVVVLRSSNERAFCAGGDMKATRLLALDQRWEILHQFFAEEYALNLHIDQCAKPYVSLVNGIAMGGGLGLSVHGDVMIVSETARLAMPETAIGFFPDVGGTYFLSRLIFDAGLWLALTGMEVKGADAVTSGLATHYVKQAFWPELIDAFASEGRQALNTTLTAVSTSPPDSDFTETLKQRQSWFAGNDHSTLVSTLTAASADNDDAARLLSRLESKSPYAMDLTRRLLAEAKKHDLAKCLELELIAADEAVRHPDFTEGIRAVLVDKDKPSWVSAHAS